MSARRLVNLGLILLLSMALRAAEEIPEFQEVRLKPCILVQSNLGADVAERKANARKFAEHIADTSDFFMKAFRVTAKDFVEYAKRRHQPPDNGYEIPIQIRIWGRYENFLTDFQHRYETKTIPAAFFGIIRRHDEYGERGDWFREIGAHGEGATDEQILRHLYHEMGHLFMRTYIFYSAEVPNWIEEGVAEIFQYRKGNGTNPEADRLERWGWLRSMVELEPGGLGAMAPWREFSQVRNADNLDFTYQNPLRSTVQYAQVWAVMEYMIETRRRSQALTRLLDLIKAEAQKLTQEALGKGLRGQEFRDYTNARMYQKQYAMFRQCYGIDFMELENMWKAWVIEQYEDRLRRHPGLFYHRGAWHLTHRLRWAKDDAFRAQILQRAEACFREGIERAPEASESYVGMARLAMARQDMEEAGEWFAKARARGADDFETLLYGGIAQIRSGRPEEAIEGLDAAVAQRPTHFDANFQRALAYAASGRDFDVALTGFKRAIDIRPSSRAKVGVYTGVAAYKAGEVHEAKLQFFHVRNADPDNRLLPALEAVVLRFNGEITEAKRLLGLAKEQGSQLAAAFLERMATGAAYDLGFTRNGVPGVVGLTIKAEDVVGGDAQSGDDAPDGQ